MITLAATARFFDPDDALADDERPASFLLGDPDDAVRVYSCLIDTAADQDRRPCDVGRVHVRLPMLTSYTVREPVPLWRGTIVGELREVTVLSADDCESDQTSARVDSGIPWWRPGVPGSCPDGPLGPVDVVTFGHLS
ncbi:hypothetical protein [Catenulispora subtropica]|uniref:Uncharacterized protein n=1 Tax=Catenulispora subtropica TaxID=450798 RepID=A0ABP5EPD0_9ACTN